MQVVANVDEADIGGVKEGNRVTSDSTTQMKTDTSNAWSGVEAEAQP